MANCIVFNSAKGTICHGYPILQPTTTVKTCYDSHTAAINIVKCLGFVKNHDC